MELGEEERENIEMKETKGTVDAKRIGGRENSKK